MALSAQIADSPASERGESWTTVTESKRDNVNNSRTIESHTQSGNRTLDIQSVQVRGVDGYFDAYQDIERETVQVNGSTVRTMTRTFARDVNKAKTLVEVTEEEKRTLANGESTIVRITSSPDTNGKLQVNERESVQTRKIAESVEETQSTVDLPNMDGRLAPAVKTQEITTRDANDKVEAKKTTFLLDGGGKWQVKEVRQTTSRREGDNRITEERLSQIDAEGKLREFSRVVSAQSEDFAGDKRATVETYSADVPGVTRDGSLHIVKRVTAAQPATATGEQITEQRVEQLDPGATQSGLRVYVLINDTLRPIASGAQATRTVQMRDGGGNFGVVSVDMTNSDRAPSIDVQQTPSEKPKSTSKQN
jgi:hypothetical protein